VLRLSVLLTILVLALSLAATGGSPAEDARTGPEAENTRMAETTEEGVTQEDLLEILDRVHGERARRLFRIAYWAAGLEGDMKAVYGEYGYPSYRYREIKVGITLEKWTYLDEGKQFVFRDGELERTRKFNPGSAAGLYLD
jgi:hypothetical protein